MTHLSRTNFRSEKPVFNKGVSSPMSLNVTLKRFPTILFALAVVALLGQAAWTAENAVVEARILEDMKFLTSDECEGRGINTKGINLAAEHIAQEFKKAGLKPAGDEGTYFQHFGVIKGSKLGETNELLLRGPQNQRIALEMGKHFSVIALGGGGKVSAPVVFAGYGVTASEPKYDDYAGLDVAGKVVIVLRRMPRQGNEANPFNSNQNNQHASLLSKVTNAQAHKAAAIILVNDNVLAAEKQDELVTFEYTAQSRETADVPALHLRRSFVNHIIESSLNMGLAEVEKEIDRNFTPLSQPLPGWTCELQTSVTRESTPVKNVIGVLEGNGPLAKEIVVIGAHYDHLGYGGAGSLAPGSKAIHRGADDNASGTSTVIELARRFGAARTPPLAKGGQGGCRKLVFMTFSGEESGLLGSAHYCKKPLFPLEDTVAMVNMDMVGRLREDKLTIGGTGTAKTFDALIDELNAKHKLQIQKDKTGYGPSDHQSFYGKKIPVFFFYTGMHQQYHKPADTVDTINIPGMRKVADMVEDLTTALATDPKRPEYQYVAGTFNPSGRSSGPSGPSGPRMGVVPSYSSDDKPGLVLDGVSDNGPAKKAGLLAGDRILEISGKPVKDISAYMTIMAGFKKGDTLQVIVERKGEKKTIPVLLE
jgi:hypothetical protein